MQRLRTASALLFLLLGAAPHARAAAQSAATSPPAASAADAQAAPAAPAPDTAALDLAALQQRLRDTTAIGLFTKLSLKNQVDDLIAQFRAFHHGSSQLTLAQLRQRFEVLLLKVVTLLQDDDPQLASAVSASREAIWSVLSDPKKLANI